MDEVVWLVIHHTGEGSARPTVQSTAAYQTGPKAHLQFPAIAYTFYIEEDGRASLCHDLEAVTWAQGSGSPYTKRGIGLWNWVGWGICFAGEHPTPAQKATIRAVGDYLDTLLGRKLTRLGHRDVSVDGQGWPLTLCPGTLWKTWSDEIGN